jgi:hypothetical protein
MPVLIADKLPSHANIASWLAGKRQVRLAVWVLAPVLAVVTGANAQAANKCSWPKLLANSVELRLMQNCVKMWRLSGPAWFNMLNDSDPLLIEERDECLLP